MKLKYLFIPMILVFLLVAFAKAPEAGQQSTSSPEEEKVQALVETFFEGFHKQDSMLIKKVVHENVLMQSIGKNQIGEIVLSKEDFSGFLSSICSIPETTSFEERIHDYKIQMDGKMANVWTPYSFYINGNLSHCGTNSFQLFKRNGVWKIFYIVDTRDRSGCDRKRG
ncbi:MAG: 3-methyl-2-oxobutanoate hydroxymethyltransferase [Cytophagaceae bacterium]|nr:3-methyl-2-oxobutanoate hydroxymethyltransferase [Cytophagaceae bacterium]